MWCREEWQWSYKVVWCGAERNDNGHIKACGVVQRGMVMVILRLAVWVRED